ncbi:MAG TPA: aminotransferase class IV [Labilithrix sp.]|nr:aminotransferase class IV [Labilithrix sp.]
MVLDRENVPFDAPVVERGVGFFETLLLVGRRVALWEPHVERLFRTLRHWDLPCPTREHLAAAAAAAIARERAPLEPERALRLSWIAVGHDLDTLSSWRLDASVRPIPASTLARRSGSRAITLAPEFVRDTPFAKSTSYLAAVLGLRHARRAGADEGFFVSPEGAYLEGTSTAVVAWNDGCPLLAMGSALPSVTAEAFAGPSIQRDVLTRDKLVRGAIVLGALTKAAPLLSLDGAPCDVPAPMAARIMEFNRQLVLDASSP